MFGKGEKIKGKKNGRYHMQISEETRIKLKHPKTEEQKNNQRESMKGKIPWNKGKNHIYSFETLQKMKKIHILTEKQCPYCMLIGKGPNMTRYHFNNCKI